MESSVQGRIQCSALVRVRCSASQCRGEFGAVECSSRESLAKVRASPFSSTLNIILGLATHCTAELQSHFVSSVIPQQHLEKFPLKESARAGWCERWPSLPKPLPFPNRAARNSQNHQVAEDPPKSQAGTWLEKCASKANSSLACE